MDRLYYIKPKDNGKEKLVPILKKHPEIKFVSFMGIDIGGNGTDEKIPISLFIKDMEEMLSFGIQTDGSSVELQGIVTLENARVDLIPDKEAKWIVDYNYEHYCDDNKNPVGTLRIPSFILHNEKMVCSRSILKRTVSGVQKEIKEIFFNNPKLAKKYGFKVEELDEVLLTSATELELWVKTPDDKADIEALSTSQTLKEQYWKRTTGLVRTVLERSIIELENYGLEPEMGHKEVGGIANKFGTTGRLKYVMEQLEIDWKYTTALQTADNEIIAREVIEDVFRRHGLEVTFMAKPLEGVAGNGEHTHIGLAVKLKTDKIINLFTPIGVKKDFLSDIGYGALMGILRHYDIINPFVSSTNDSFNRLKPGFEAPVCTVTSLGVGKEVLSRNRSVLVGVIRDFINPLATRFELRSPNPLSNTYLVIAATYQGALDGILTVVEKGLKEEELEKIISKKPGEEVFYLEKEKSYRSEKNVFEHYTQEERDKLFGPAPATVWENLENLNNGGNRVNLLKKDGAFTEELIKSYKLIILDKWVNELTGRIIPNNIEILRSLKKLHTDLATDLDVINWEKINTMRIELMKDSTTKISIFSKINDAVKNKDYKKASEKQKEMNNKMSQIRAKYSEYKRNII